MRTGTFLAQLLWITLLPASAASTAEQIAGRPATIHTPANPHSGAPRALVVVLHGGFGSAETIEARRAEVGLNLDAMADKHGFVVAYLNGTRAGRLLPERLRAWNAGQCCGLPQRSGVDDQGYIRTAVTDLSTRYRIAPDRVFAVGHSNGSMMALAMACMTDTFAAVVAISGPLMLALDHCPAAPGKRILALHGAKDENVPVAGGIGRLSVARVNFISEARSQSIFEQSGARTTLELLDGAGHMLGGIDTELQRTRGTTLQAKIVDFFKLAQGQ
jgi:polyhydroxybutyrate depolymerase